MILDKYMMKDAQKADRRLSIGGSDAQLIMSGKEDWIHELWLDKTGQKERVLEPTINILIGITTEQLNADWYTHTSDDQVTCRGMTARRDDLGFPAHATLDGLCLNATAVWEAKHTNGYSFAERARSTAETTAAYYGTQLQHNMAVCKLDHAVMSVLFDNNRHEYVTVESDPFFQDEMHDACAKFWDHVKAKTPPRGFVSAAPKVKVEAVKEVDMSGNNEWAAAANDYITHGDAASAYAAAETALKNLTEADVKIAKGYGVMVKRDKRGAARIYKE